MAYKVTYNTYAICGDNKIGNIIQSQESIYTDKEIKDIPEALNTYLLPRVRVGDIISIEKVNGKCLA